MNTLHWISKLVVLLFASTLGFGCLADAGEPVRERIEPAGMFDHPAYTHLITTSGNWKTLYVAGQVASDSSGACVAEGNWHGQYVQVMENLKTVLAAGGATFADVTFIRRFVTSIDDYFAMLQDNSAPIPDYFAGAPPASTLLEVSRLASRCYLMEFDIIATIPAK